MRDNEEWFYDSNGDGQWTDANGRYDNDTMISAYFKLVWTGIPEENETAAWITYSPNNTTCRSRITHRARETDRQEPQSGGGIT